MINVRKISFDISFNSGQICISYEADRKSTKTYQSHKIFCKMSDLEVIELLNQIFARK